MFTALRPAALGIAAEWSVPGMDPDDVRQEALLALWLATEKYDPERGPWPPFARLAVKAQMVTLLRASTRQKRTAVFERDVDVAAPVREDGGLGDVLAVMHVLSDRERAALAAHLNGTPARSSKAHETALYRARAKLRAAA